MITLLLAAAVLQEAGVIDEISIHHTQGKPHDVFAQGKPDREIVARRDKQGFTYVARLNAPWTGAKQYTERTGTLTADEYASLEKIVRDHKLLDWKAEEGERADCWGSAGIAIRGQKQTVQSWSAPLKNGAGADALIEAVAKLLDAKLKARDAITELRCDFSNGEPTKTFDPARPHEAVFARRTEKGFEVGVAVNVPRKDVDRFTEQKAEITAAEWEALTGLVERERLREWKTPGKQGAPDWGQGGFTIYSAEGDKRQTWMSPIDAAAAPEVLRKALAQLAAAKVKELPLEMLK